MESQSDVTQESLPVMQAKTALDKQFTTYGGSRNGSATVMNITKPYINKT